MQRLGRSLVRGLALTGRVEHFVRLIVTGGLALVAGLWLVDLGTPSEPAWLGGLALALVALLVLATGIWRQVEPSRIQSSGWRS